MSFDAKKSLIGSSLLTLLITLMQITSTRPLILTNLVNNTSATSLSLLKTLTGCIILTPMTQVNFNNTDTASRILATIIRHDNPSASEAYIPKLGGLTLAIPLIITLITVLITKRYKLSTKNKILTLALTFFISLLLTYALSANAYYTGAYELGFTTEQANQVLKSSSNDNPITQWLSIISTILLILALIGWFI